MFLFVVLPAVKPPQANSGADDAAEIRAALAPVGLCERRAEDRLEHPTGRVVDDPAGRYPEAQPARVGVDVTHTTTVLGECPEGLPRSARQVQELLLVCRQAKDPRRQKSRARTLPHSFQPPGAHSAAEPLAPRARQGEATSLRHLGNELFAGGVAAFAGIASHPGHRAYFLQFAHSVLPEDQVSMAIRQALRQNQNVTLGQLVRAFSACSRRRSGSRCPNSVVATGAAARGSAGTCAGASAVASASEKQRGH
mmetsp:Transcript_5726/g.14281  ORF Transcript_5726/g.14281 Transcript_5726/m.14281 type:complete len:253 (-) Transcript_5726:115-873(-)